jgi:hypothetical protein
VKNLEVKKSWLYFVLRESAGSANVCYKIVCSNFDDIFASKTNTCHHLKSA